MVGYVEYTCRDCGFEYSGDMSLFYYDSETKTTQEYILLRSTAGISDGSKIKGETAETYCKYCNKFIRTYYIEDPYISYIIHNITPPKMDTIDVDDAKRIISEGIENRLRYVKEKLDKAIEEENENQIETYQSIYQYENTVINRIVHMKEENKNFTDSKLYTILCPNCNNKIYEYINDKYPCPKCGGEMVLTKELLTD